MSFLKKNIIIFEKSYSISFVDLVIDKFFKNKGVYIDIGCNHQLSIIILIYFTKEVGAELMWTQMVNL